LRICAKAAPKSRLQVARVLLDLLLGGLDRVQHHPLSVRMARRRRAEAGADVEILSAPGELGRQAAPGPFIATLSAAQKILFAINAHLADDYDVVGDASKPILDATWEPADWSAVADMLRDFQRLKPWLFRKPAS